MDWISLAIAIALLVVAVYSGISYFREKKQSAVYLGDSALFTIIPSYAHRENGLRA
ncbi:small membrane protein, partial [Klebsiella pneumoniae]